jgi:acyl carrier protein
MNRIEKNIYEWIKKKNREVKLNENLLKNRTLDSFNMMELIIFCEKKFQIRFKDIDLNNKNFTSIKKIASVISKYQKDIRKK